MDYMDEEGVEQIPTMQLRPGEVSCQTRRSMDRHQDFGTRPAPSYVILGAQKAGTTSLYHYIIQQFRLFAVLFHRLLA
ncbi:MAG: hypothetical protein MUC48_04435, partial [Leptolyngbya sp. Prado105]|nr:hypothetical protein [Leptolyngbya sp. Prado105]